MNSETAPSDPSGEIRVEGVWLLLVVAAIVALVVGAFALGRLSAPVAERAVPLPEAAAAEAPVEESVESKPSRFDAVGGGGTAAEPKRQLGSESPPRSPQTPSPQPAATGPWVVQVFAGRDRRAAESLVVDLRSRGYAVRLDSQRDGRDALFKVRVGGYASEAEARVMADRLKGEGESAAWVTRAR